MVKMTVPFRTSGPARMILAPPSSFEAAFPAFLPQGRGISRKDDGAMSLFARLLQAVRSWRRRRVGVALRPSDTPASPWNSLIIGNY